MQISEDLLQVIADSSISTVHNELTMLTTDCIDRIHLLVYNRIHNGKRNYNYQNYT